MKIKAALFAHEMKFLGLMSQPTVGTFSTNNGKLLVTASPVANENRIFLQTELPIVDGSSSEMKIDIWLSKLAEASRMIDSPKSQFVTLSADAELFTARCGTLKMSFHHFRPTAQFQPHVIPSISPGPRFEVRAREFGKALTKARWFAGKRLTTKYNLDGVRLHASENHLVVTSFNGHAFHTSTIDCQGEGDVLLAWHAVTKVARISPDPDDAIAITINDDYVFVECPPRRITVPTKSQFDFPILDLQTVIPVAECVVNVAALVEAVEMSLVFSRYLLCRWGDGHLKVCACDHSGNESWHSLVMTSGTGNGECAVDARDVMRYIRDTGNDTIHVRLAPWEAKEQFALVLMDENSALVLATVSGTPKPEEWGQA